MHYTISQIKIDFFVCTKKYFKQVIEPVVCVSLGKTKEIKPDNGRFWRTMAQD